MCSLVMSLFLGKYIKVEIDSLKYQLCFNILKCVQYSHSTWFLDGRTSVFVNLRYKCKKSLLCVYKLIYLHLINMLDTCTYVYHFE